MRLCGPPLSTAAVLDAMLSVMAMSLAKPPDLDPVLSMRWASAGKMPVLEIMSRELQHIAAMLAAYNWLSIVVENRGNIY